MSEFDFFCTSTNKVFKPQENIKAQNVRCRVQNIRNHQSQKYFSFLDILENYKMIHKINLTLNTITIMATRSDTPFIMPVGADDFEDLVMFWAVKFQQRG